MSTKIYNGFRIPNTSLTQWQQGLTSQIREFRSHAQEIAFAVLGSGFVGALDCADTLDVSEPLVSPHDAVESRLLQSFVDSQWKMQRDPIYDGQCTLMVKPYKGDLLVGLFCENRGLASLAKSLFQLEDFGYWDNTDPDEACTPEQWEYRRKAWEDCLGDLSWIEAGFLAVELTSPTWFKQSFTDLLFAPRVLARLIQPNSRVERFVRFAASQACEILYASGHLKRPEGGLWERAKTERAHTEALAALDAFKQVVVPYFEARRAELNDTTQLWALQALPAQALWAVLSADDALLKRLAFDLAGLR